MNQRDLELLSSYLDGQLKPSDSARLERRLASDPNLRSVLDDLRGARGLLRKLPMRKAPRNFTLTPKMVGKNPPLPRTYPAFKFVTALAAVLLFFTFGVNFLAPQIAAAPRAFGMGGGGAPETYSSQAPATQAPALQAPAPTQAPATGAPAAPSIGLAPMVTATVPAAEDTARAAATTAEKNAATAEAGAQTQPQIENAPAQPLPLTKASAPTPPVPYVWQVTLAGVVLLGILVMLLMRRLAAERWQK